jgi:hypothetical protein
MTMIVATERTGRLAASTARVTALSQGRFQFK